MTQTAAIPRITLRPGIDLCQNDLPLDWYQPEFRPYAEEYFALPDRRPESVLPWLDGYVGPAVALGPSLLLAALYMGGEIVKLRRALRQTSATVTHWQPSPRERRGRGSRAVGWSFHVRGDALLAEPISRCSSRTPKPAAPWR